jgi:hypothetical protein
MKKLLIGLLMLVTTNVMAIGVEKTPPPTFPVTTTDDCVKGKLYNIERSEAHVTVQRVYEYNKLLNAWFHITCKKV